MPKSRDQEILNSFERRAAATALLAGNPFQGFAAIDIVLGLKPNLAKSMGILPKEWSDEKCLLVMHKYRYEMKQASESQRQESREWLQSRGFHRLYMEPWSEDGSLP